MKNTFLVMKLEAFAASTSKTVSVDTSLNILSIVYKAALDP